MNVDVDVDVTTPTPNGTLFAKDEVFRLGDATVTPLILHWASAPNFSMNAQFAIQAPTGDYDKDRAANAGVNFWLFAPSFAVSYVTSTGLEFSFWFQLNIGTKNDDTDYKNGVEYLQDFSIGQHVGPWRIGLGGYYYKQISDDKTYMWRIR
jgi:Protein involved in meta-pathway of phenol degradation